MDLRAKPFYLTDEQIDWVEQTLADMTLEQKAAQIFVVMGDDFTAEQRAELAERYGVGGMLFRPAPKAQLTEEYQKLDSLAKIPLLKAANLEEGGSGAISDGTMYGWPMVVGATDDVEQVKRFAAVTATEGMSCGCRMNYAPVCDIDFNFRNPITNVRTYGSDAERVYRMTEAYVETLQSYGMAACAKHFPGDGRDFRDQHLHPTVNDLSAEQWYASYGRIYQNLINKGLMGIMCGHILQPAVEMDLNPELRYEDCLPGSLSKTLLTGVLREKFGFNGLISTDATIMNGYTQCMPRAQALPTSIMAGCDMLVFNTDFYEDHQSILEAVESGLLTTERLDDAIRRILATKAKVLNAEAPAPIEESAAWRKECAEHAVTLVKDKDRIIPISTQKYDTVRLITLGQDNCNEGSIRQMVKALLEQEGFAVELYDPMQDELHGSKTLSRRRLTLYLAYVPTRSNQTVARLTWSPHHTVDSPRYISEEDCAMISFNNPYHLQDAPRMRCYINAYSANKALIEASVEKMLGKSRFMGVSPVDPFCGLPDAQL
jgi:beta-N-acetylhexosaminidase